MQKCLVILVLTSLLSSTTARKIPPALKICSRSDPDLKNCLARAIEQALPYVKNGVSELGIPPADPLTVGSVSNEGNPDRPINLALKFIDTKLHNLVNSQVNTTEIVLNNDEFKMTLDIFNKDVLLDGSYEMDGKILVLPIKGHGHAKLNFRNVLVVVTQIGGYFEKKGKKHIKLNEVRVRIEPENITTYFENVFNGDQRLEAEFSNLLKENWKQIFEEIRAPYEEAMGMLFKQIFQSFFNKFTYDQLFPL